MKILYCDCFSGISGDMFLSALIDMGLPLEVLLSRLKLLNLPESFDIKANRVHKGPIAASQVAISFQQEDHSHQRNFGDIQKIINDSSLAEKEKEKSQSIFKALAEAEATVHGASLEEVHFHEVGALDSIIDIVGAAIGLNFFDIDRMHVSALPLGSGQVQSQHGILPLPAPATLELLRRAGAQVVPSQARVELVTPTGAAIVATAGVFSQPSMKITGLGIGAGRQDLDWPNVLRLVKGDSEDVQAFPMVQIETNIDDMNPQIFGHVMDLLFSSGALDVYFTPIQMKKNRPATMLSIIANRFDEAALAKIILEETTTMGMRVIPIYRYEASRQMQIVQTEYGPVPIKLKIFDGMIVQASPEYDVCSQLAIDKNVPLIHIYQAALQAGRKLITPTLD